MIGHVELNSKHTNLKISERDVLLIGICLHAYQSFFIVVIVSSVIVVTGSIVSPVTGEEMVKDA